MKTPDCTRRWKSSPPSGDEEGLPGRSLRGVLGSGIWRRCGSGAPDFRDQRSGLTSAGGEARSARLQASLTPATGWKNILGIYSASTDSRRMRAAGNRENRRMVLARGRRQRGRIRSWGGRRRSWMIGWAGFESFRSAPNPGLAQGTHGKSESAIWRKSWSGGPHSSGTRNGRCTSTLWRRAAGVSWGDDWLDAQPSTISG